jgi:hypothetical protein
VAAKHDAKKARANHWVMQQNLAKQKGGRPGYKFNEKRPPKPPAKIAPVPAVSGEAPKAEDATIAEPAGASTSDDAPAADS